MNEFSQALDEANIRIHHGYATGVVLDDVIPCLRYRVEIEVDSQTILETDYHISLGMAPKLPQKWRERFTWSSDVNDMLAWLCRNPGKFPRDKAKHAHAIGVWTNHQGHTLDRDDVMESLLSDSDAIEYPDFESWADDLGYDTDSRKAESAYRACLATALKLRAALGSETLGRLRELALDR